MPLLLEKEEEKLRVSICCGERASATLIGVQEQLTRPHRETGLHLRGSSQFPLSDDEDDDGDDGEEGGMKQDADREREQRETQREETLSPDGGRDVQQTKLAH